MAALEPSASYQIVVSGDVRQRFRELSKEANDRGDGAAYIAALKAFMARLAVYPQFGDPIIDLTMGEGQVRVRIIRPLSMRYGVHEDRKLVICGSPPLLLPMEDHDATTNQ